MTKRLARITQFVSRPGHDGLVPVSAATWWRWSARGLAPKGIKVGPNVTCWDLAEIELWLERLQQKSKTSKSKIEMEEGHHAKE